MCLKKREKEEKRENSGRESQILDISHFTSLMHLSRQTFSLNGMDSAERIWVLGAKCYNADRSIQWDSEFPNFADPDILIINLTSLTKEVLERIRDKYIVSRDSIVKKFSSGDC